ncbi:MAG: HD domain-containing protein [Nanoarchaeota archaeon]|nr:HD domain-containing protein [Nanoarchaeota archaeon]
MENLLEFFIEVDKLKRTYRFSTRDKSVHDSVADHSWKLALIVISVAEKLNLNVDILHSVKLALCHDIPEYITGEIDSRLIHLGKFSKEEKLKLEKKASEEINKKFGIIGEQISDLWREYEGCKTREAKYVKALDKIEAITHLLSLDKIENDDFGYTATYANESVKNFPELKFMLKEIQNKLKIKYEKFGEKWKSDYEID